MKRDMLMLRLEQVEREGSPEELSRLARLFWKLIPAFPEKESDWVVVQECPGEEPRRLYTGPRDLCIAFRLGFERATLKGFEPPVFVCVNIPSLPVVVPEEQLGRMLGKECTGNEDHDD